MPEFLRWFVPGASYFFTQVTHRRSPFLCAQASQELLHRLLVECKARWPFTIDAMVLLPDHLHTIWTLPPGDDAFPRRWGWLKKEFTREWLLQGHQEGTVSDSRRHERRRGVWQPRYWEHLIRDEQDYEDHFHYVHFNPVKHGLVSRPRDWPWSSFHRWTRKGIYDRDWGSVGDRVPDFRRIERTVGEAVEDAPVEVVSEQEEESGGA